jgi:hypothetical protein
MADQVMYRDVELEYPPHVIEGFRDLGSFGGGGSETDVDTAAAYYILDQRPYAWQLDLVRLWHDGLDAATGNSFQFDLYKVPSGTEIASAEFTDARKIATQISVTATTVGISVDFTLSATNSRLCMFAEGDALVLVVSSVDDISGTESYDSSGIDNVRVSHFGLVGSYN